MTVSDVMAEVRKDVLFYDESGGGVTFSGGEPLMQPDFLLSLLDGCRAEAIHTAVDTTCCADWDVIDRVARMADLFLCDIKHMNGDTHRRYTGVDNATILRNITTLARIGSEMIVRIPVIPGFNDDEKNLSDTADFVRSLGNVRRIDILPYNRGGLEKAARLTGEMDVMQAETPEESRMGKVAEMLRMHGFDVRTGG